MNLHRIFVLYFLIYNAYNNHFKFIYESRIFRISSTCARKLKIFTSSTEKKGGKQSTKSQPRPNFDFTLDMESLKQIEDYEAELDHHPDDDDWNEMCDDEEEPEPLPVPNSSLAHLLLRSC